MYLQRTSDDPDHEFSEPSHPIGGPSVRLQLFLNTFSFRNPYVIIVVINVHSHVRTT
jgi:hypothetical protein